ncbi:MAG: ParB/RepB/Spo0J family partition protein [Bifidobacterium sp.]|nr:ParB/RepB/Spo0J family partition protein [Bifidobacterium sp.]
MNDQIRMIPVEKLHPHPGNPRRDVGDVSELAESIRAQGVRQNLLVVPMGPEQGYRVVIGHRRLAAAKLAGLTEVPCVVDGSLDGKRQLELMIVENSQRTDLTPIEEADAYQGLLDLGSDIRQISKQTGRSGSYVRSRIKMASIPQEVRGKAKDFAQLTVTELQDLADFDDDPETQAKLAEAAGTSNWDYKLSRARDERREREWVADAEKYIKEHHLPALPDGVKLPDSAWEIPSGWDRVAQATALDHDDSRSFGEQWEDEDFSDHPGYAVCVRDGGVQVLVPKPKKAAPDLSESEKRRKAEERARMKLVRELHSTSRQLREQWLHANVHSLDDAKWTLAATRLIFNDLMGGDEYYYNTGIAADDMDRMIKAYDAISGGNVLPVIDKVSGRVWHLDGKENWQAMHDRQQRSPQPEVIVLLCARAEGHITANAWDWQTARDRYIRPYYRILAGMGYPVSDAEVAALKGEFGHEDA